MLKDNSLAQYLAATERTLTDEKYLLQQRPNLGSRSHRRNDHLHTDGRTIAAHNIRSRFLVLKVVLRSEIQVYLLPALWILESMIRL